VPIGLTVVVTLMLVALWSQKDNFIQSLKALFNLESESDSNPIPSQEFAVDIEVSNIRTQDYLRANVEATVYVFIADKPEDKQKAETSLVIEDSISAIAVEKAVKKRAESAIRGSASQKTLDELHGKREEVGKTAKELMGKCLNHLGLTVREIVVGEIEENPNYSENNYFDAQALKARTEKIQNAILETRKIELNRAKEIREKELEDEKTIHKKELDIGKEMKIKELQIRLEVEKEELNHQEESIKNLTKFEETEKKKINHEFEIELHKNQKEKELQKEIETTDCTVRKEIETEELTAKKEIESLRTKTEIEIQLEKIKQETDLINQNKELQKLQAEVHQEVEKAEIAATISIISKEQERLETEMERAKAEEAITTAIEEAIALRQQLKAKIAAQAVEDEAKTIKLLAEAEGTRYHSIPATDADRTDKLIRELAPQLIEHLPQLAEVVKALAPQPGILGESNIYTVFGHCKK
jgi:uncharacterized membrane protein YqiK